MQGCAGVGIVNALEVVHAFPGQEGLAAFRAWVESPDVGVAAAARSLAGEEAGDGEPRTTNGTCAVVAVYGLRCGFRPPSILRSIACGRLTWRYVVCCDAGDAQPDDTPARLEFKRGHRGVRRNWQLPASFPSPAVLEAYLSPRLDANKNKFTFGRPDLELLRNFCT